MSFTAEGYPEFGCSECERKDAEIEQLKIASKATRSLIAELADFTSLCADYPLGMVWSVTLRDKARELLKRTRSR